MSFRKEFTNQEIGQLMYELSQTDLYEQTIRDFIRLCTSINSLNVLEYEYGEVMEFYEIPDDNPDYWEGNILYDYVRTLYLHQREQLTNLPKPQDITNVATSKGQIVPVVVTRSDLE